MRMIVVRIMLLVCSLLLPACTGASAEQQNDLLPQAVKEAIIASEYDAEEHRNVQVEVTGEATILQHEKDQGIEKGLCLHIRYEKKLADRWVAGVNSRVIQQKGDEWIVNNALLAVERAWAQHSCVGAYELTVPQ